MESKNFVTGRQMIIVLLISKLLFSSDFIPGIHAGTSIQDILPSIPIVFAADLLVAVPVFLLMKRHPGKDLVECSMQLIGKPLGTVMAAVYFLFFTLEAAIILGTFNCFYSISIVRETEIYAIIIPLLLVCTYGAIRGIETICRFGTLVFFLYLFMLAIIFISITPKIDTGYLKPLFYNGYGIFFKATVAGINSSFQALVLALCAPFLKPRTGIFKLYLLWDLVSTALIFVLFFFVVTILGAFGSSQIFPLHTLSMLANIGVFERLESFVMISWILNVILVMATYLFAASQCMMRTPLKKFRKTVIFAAALLVAAAEPFITRNYIKSVGLLASPYLFLAMMILVVLLPLFVLLADLIREAAAKAGGNPVE